MDITGSYTFNASPDRVWSLLMDPAVIASCIPGCEQLEPDGDDRYKARLTVGLAAITGTYDGTVVITETVPPSSYRLTVEGPGQAGLREGECGDRPSRRRRDDGGRGELAPCRPAARLRASASA